MKVLEIKRQAVEVDQRIEACYEKLLEHLRQQRDKLKGEVREASIQR